MCESAFSGWEAAAIYVSYILRVGIGFAAGRVK